MGPLHVVVDEERLFGWVRQVAGLGDHRWYARGEPVDAIEVFAATVETGADTVAPSTNPVRFVVVESVDQFFEEDPAETARLGVTAIDKNLGSRRRLRPGCTTIVMNRHERLRLQGICDFSSATERKANVCRTGEKDRISGFLEIPLRDLGDAQV